MKRAALLALAACALSACVAETVERHRPRKGPVKEVGYVDFGGGNVRYSAEGWPMIVASRRRLALKLMARNCGRELKPRITDEYTRQDADASYAGDDVTSLSNGETHYVIERYVHLTYECRPEGWVEPAVSTAAARAPVVVVPEASTSTAVSVSTPVAAAIEISTPAASAAPPSPSSSTLPSPEPPR